MNTDDVPLEYRSTRGLAPELTFGDILLEGLASDGGLYVPDHWPALAIPMFALGTIGGVAGYAVQWYANARSYALNIGGRPAHAALPFILPSLEALLLFAGLTAFAGLLIALRLPRLWRPVFEIDGFERASIDRYWVAVGLGSGGGDLARTTRELVSMQPLRILHVAAEP